MGLLESLRAIRLGGTVIRTGRLPDNMNLTKEDEAKLARQGKISAIFIALVLFFISLYALYEGNVVFASLFFALFVLFDYSAISGRRESPKATSERDE